MIEQELVDKLKRIRKYAAKGVFEASMLQDMPRFKEDSIDWATVRVVDVSATISLTSCYDETAHMFTLVIGGIQSPGAPALLDYLNEYTDNLRVLDAGVDIIAFTN